MGEADENVAVLCNESAMARSRIAELADPNALTVRGHVTVEESV